VEKYDRARHATGDDIIWHMCLVGTVVAQQLRRYATDRKVAGSIPAGVIGIFH